MDVLDYLCIDGSLFCLYKRKPIVLVVKTITILLNICNLAAVLQIQCLPTLKNIELGYDRKY
jgi:hypothetical protein